MLKSLLIKNFILFNQVSLDFTKGFNVLCGETGAGKSIIIKALDCVLGAKMTKEMLLDKNKPCYIEAVFLNQINQEITISKEFQNQSKYRIDGVLMTLDEIREIRQSLLDIHSQHQTYSYMQSKSHIHLLDNYIIKNIPEYFELLNSYKKNYNEFKETSLRLENAKNNLENNQKEIDFLKFQFDELSLADVKENEEEDLNAQLDVLSNIQELKEESFGCYFALYGENQNIIEALGNINHVLSNLSALDKTLVPIQESLYGAQESLKDCANTLRDYSNSLEYNATKLDELNERIALIQKLKRKYGADLINEQKNIEEKLKNLTKNTDNIEELEKNYNSLIEILDLLSKNIREYRIQYAQKLSKLIEEKLKTLELKEAKFDISVLPAQRNENGTDSVEFMISTNKNKDLGPLSKVASGGEISRVILALKSIFALCDKVSTVVFDEIDTGISGITSNAVANSIIELSKSTQIICITHQPIICAKADNFIWINKTHGTKTDVTIEVLDESQRLSALAQLASGEITQQTIDFAKTLVK